MKFCLGQTKVCKRAQYVEYIYMPGLANFPIIVVLICSYIIYIRKLYLTIYNCANDIVNRNAMREKVEILHDSYLALYGIAKKTQFFSSA